MGSARWREVLVRLVAWLLRVPRDGTPRTTRTQMSIPAPAPAPLEPNTWLMLDSTHPYLRFRAGMVIRYTAGSPHLPPGQAFQVARAAIHRRAEKISTQYPLTQDDRLRGELAVELAEHRPAGGGVVAWAACTGIEVNPTDHQAVQQYEEAQRGLQVSRWQDELREYRMRSYQSLLTDPLRATTWWLTTNQDRDTITQLPDVARAFRELATILAPTPTVEPQAPDTLGHTIDDFLRDADPPAVHLTYQQMTRLYTDHNRADLISRAQRLNGTAPAAAGEADAEE